MQHLKHIGFNPKGAQLLPSPGVALTLGEEPEAFGGVCQGDMYSCLKFPTTGWAWSSRDNHGPSLRGQYGTGHEVLGTSDCGCFGGLAHYLHSSVSQPQPGDVAQIRKPVANITTESKWSKLHQYRRVGR